MNRRKIRAIVIVLCVFFTSQSFAQKWTKITCYPGIQLTIDTTQWDPQYVLPVHTDLFGAQLPVATKGKDPEELLVCSFHVKEEVQSLRLAFMAQYPKKAFGLSELPEINGFAILKMDAYGYIALKQFSAHQVAMVVFVSPNQKQKKSIKEFTALLGSVKFLTLEEMDGVCGYPLANYAKDKRSHFFSIRADNARKFNNKMMYVEEFMRSKFSPLSYDDTVASEKDFSFSTFEKERQRLNKGEFTEQECLDMNFLPKKKWRSSLYWELNSANIPGYKSEFKYNNPVQQSSERYGVLTGDTLSFKLSSYPSELPWKHIDYSVIDFSRKGVYYRMGRTTDAIHFFVYSQDKTGTWQKKHTELKRPFPNTPYERNSTVSSRGVLIDPDLILFDEPWRSKVSYSVMATFQKKNGRFLLPQFPSFYAMEISENLPISSVDYLPKERANSLFIFPSDARASDNGDDKASKYFGADFLYSEQGSYNIVLTNERGEPIMREEWTKEELQKQLLKIKAEKRFYFTGFYFADADNNATNDLISGWFNNGNLILNQFIGADANTLSNEQLKNVFRILNQSNLGNLSKDPADSRFNKIMNRVEYDAFVSSKYVIEEVDGMYYDYEMEGDNVIPIPVEEVRPYGDEPVSFAQEMPEYPGGDAAMQSDIAKNINYPEEMMEMGIQGKVYVSFVVEKDGSITNVKVIRGINGARLLGEEAVRAVMKLPKKFTPGKMNGKPVRVVLNVPVHFQLK